MGMYAHILFSKSELTEEDIIEMDIDYPECPLMRAKRVEVKFWTNCSWHPFHFALAETLEIDYNSMFFIEVTGQQLANALAKYITSNKVPPMIGNHHFAYETTMLCNTVILANSPDFKDRKIYYTLT